MRYVWNDEGDDHRTALASMVQTADSLSLICPYIRAEQIEDLLGHRELQCLRVITLWDLRAFLVGASEPEALGRLLQLGGDVRSMNSGLKLGPSCQGVHCGSVGGAGYVGESLWRWVDQQPRVRCGPPRSRSGRCAGGTLQSRVAPSCTSCRGRHRCSVRRTRSGEDPCERITRASIGIGTEDLSARATGTERLDAAGR